MRKHLVLGLVVMILTGMLSFSASARITILSEYEYKYLPEGGDTQTCSSAGYLSEKPNGATCSAVTITGGIKCYTGCYCSEAGYSIVDGACQNLCSGYSLSSCPGHGVCEKCESGEFYKLTDCTDDFAISGATCVCYSNYVVNGECACDESEGYTIPTGGVADAGGCDCMGCTTGYTAGITSCDENIGEYLSISGMSCGQVCGKCDCEVDANCTEENYPLTSLPAGVSAHKECTPTKGCGDTTKRYAITSCATGYELSGNTCSCKYNTSCTANNYPVVESTKVTGGIYGSSCSYAQNADCGDTTTRYKLTGCSSGYTQSGNTCVAVSTKTCEDLGFYTNVPEGQVCSPITATNGSTCYTSCGYKCCLGETYLGGKYYYDADTYEACLSVYTFPAYGVWSSLTSASICGGYNSCNYYGTVSSLSILENALSKTPYTNETNYKVSICANISSTEDIVIKSARDTDGSWYIVQLEPCVVEKGSTPEYYTISSDSGIELYYGTTSFSVDYSAPTITIYDSTIVDSHIKADKIYLKGNNRFSGVKIEPLNGDHVDIYTDFDDSVATECSLGSFDYSSYAYECIPSVYFYYTNSAYQYHYTDSNGSDTWYTAKTRAPRYDNVWGTPTKPVVFHRRTDDVLEGVMFYDYADSYPLSNITIYGYNGDSSPVFSELRFDGYYAFNNTDPTGQFNLKNYVSNTTAPLFRRLQTTEAGTQGSNLYADVKLNVYSDMLDTDGGKVAEVVSGFKNNAYLTSTETCSLGGSASNYVVSKEFDTTDCASVSCSSLGLYGHNNEYVSDYNQYCDATSEDYDLDYCNEETKPYYGVYTPVATLCDNKTWTDDAGNNVTWEKCYNRSYFQCLDTGYEVKEGDGYVVGECTQLAWDEHSNSYSSDVFCAQVTGDVDINTICEGPVFEYGGYDDSVTWTSYAEDYTTNIDGSAADSNSKCVVCRYDY